MSTPEVLTVADVMGRYRLRDRRAARRLMDEAGGFRVGAGLFVRRVDLLAFEDAAKAARQPASNPAASPPTPPLARPRTQTIATRPGWWQASTGGGTLPPPNRKR